MQFSKLTPKKIRWICTHKASETNNCNLLWHPSFVYGFYIINILNQRFYLATFVWFYLSSATFNTFNTIWNNATFKYWQTEQKKKSFSRRPRAIILDNSCANLWHMLNCNLFSNYSITRCCLNLVKKKWLFIEQLTTDDWTKRWRNSLLFAVGSFLLITQNLASLASRGMQKKKKVVCGSSWFSKLHLIWPFLLIKLFIGERHQSLTPRDYHVSHVDLV